MIITIFYLFIAVIIIQFFYYIIVFGKFSFLKERETLCKDIPISVIVCAKNEAKNIANYIPLLIEQNYSNFEIILIDDASSDETLEIFEKYEKNYSNVRLVKVDNNETFWGNKKFALTLGIKVAKNDYLLFIDADCFPVSKDWIKSMSSHFTNKKTIVLGYSTYKKIPKSFLNKIIRFENFLTAIQYFSWAKMKSPYKGISKNLGYKKEEFFKVNGFINHIKIRTGSDDLFINQIANSENTAVCYSIQSHTCSNPKTNFKSWFYEKRKQFSTLNHYKLIDKLKLGVFYTSQLLFITLSIILLLYQYQWIIVLNLIAFRYLFCFINIGFSIKKLNERGLLFWFPFLEIILILVQLNIFSANIFSKPVYWK